MFALSCAVKELTLCFSPNLWYSYLHSGKNWIIFVFYSLVFEDSMSLGTHDIHLNQSLTLATWEMFMSVDTVN